MKQTIKMAYRNLLRNRRRSLLALISITGAMIFITFMQGFMGGIMESMVRNSTRMETGHIRITSKEFIEKEKFRPVNDYLISPSDIIKRIKEDKQISKDINTIVSRISFPVMLANKGKNRAVFGIASNPEKEKVLLQLNKSILPGGRYIEKEREIIIGSKLASLLDYKVGDEVKVMANGADYALHMRKFKVVGIFETGLAAMDKNFFQIRHDDALKLLRMKEGTQQIVIFLNDYHKADKLTKLVSQLVDTDKIITKSWTQLGWAYDYMVMANSMYAFIFFLISLMGAFIIGNIMTMVVMERRREIGILKSMGYTPFKIGNLFLLEGVTLGVAGTFIGIVLGMLIVAALNVKGIDVSKMIGGVEGFTIESRIYLKVSYSRILYFISLGISVSALVSYLPARRAAKMDPVKAIKSI